MRSRELCRQAVALRARQAPVAYERACQWFSCFCYSVSAEGRRSCFLLNEKTDETEVGEARASSLIFSGRLDRWFGASGCGIQRGIDISMYAFSTYCENVTLCIHSHLYMQLSQLPRDNIACSQRDLCTALHQAQLKWCFCRTRWQHDKAKH